MSTAHGEALTMGLLALVSLVIALLDVRLKRRTGASTGWLWPAVFGVLLGVALMIVTASGKVLTGW